MLRLLLADDHDIVRRGMKELLEEQVGWSVCAEAADGRAAVELALAQRPHVAILDLSMPELNGLEATRRIKEALPQTEVLWVSTVFTLKSKTVAICLLLLPSASSWTTSRSREVRRSLGPDVTGAGPGLRKLPSTISDTRPEKNG